MKSGNVGPASSSLHRGLLLVVVVLLQSFAHLLALTQGGSSCCCTGTAPRASSFASYSLGGTHRRRLINGIRNRKTVNHRKRKPIGGICAVVLGDRRSSPCAPTVASNRGICTLLLWVEVVFVAL